MSLNVGSLAEISHDLRQRLFPDLPKGWKAFRCGVHGDGSCYYHSLSAILNYDGVMQKLMDGKASREAGINLRNEVCGTLTRDVWDGFWKSRNVSHYPEFDKIMGAFKDNKAWADLFACVYVFALCNIDVVFVDMETETKYCGITGAREACRKCFNPVANARIPDGRGHAAIIAWISHSHFEPIVIQKENRPGLERVAVLNDSKTRAIISTFSGKLRSSLLKEYEKSCSNVSLPQITKANLNGGRLKTIADEPI